MRTRNPFLFGALAILFIAVLKLYGAKPGDFSTAELAEIWTGYWKSDDPKIREPKVHSLSERDVLQRMAGKWTVMFGVIPDRLTISLSTNRAEEVSGRKDGRDWKKTGEWRVVSNKLVLFLQGDDMPSFIFRTGQHDYIFDPWAKTMMSELRREK